jgi:hypothetical protein
MEVQPSCFAAGQSLPNVTAHKTVSLVSVTETDKIGLARFDGNSYWAVGNSSLRGKRCCAYAYCLLFWEWVSVAIAVQRRENRATLTHNPTALITAHRHRATPKWVDNRTRTSNRFRRVASHVDAVLCAHPLALMRTRKRSFLLVEGQRKSPDFR